MMETERGAMRMIVIRPGTMRYQCIWNVNEDFEGLMTIVKAISNSLELFSISISKKVRFYCQRSAVGNFGRPKPRIFLSQNDVRDERVAVPFIL